MLLDHGDAEDSQSSKHSPDHGLLREEWRVQNDDGIAWPGRALSLSSFVHCGANPYQD